jgi:predicted transcriptional regulator
VIGVNKKELILKILREHPDGLTIQEIANLGKMSRITATIYIHELLGEGKIVERKIGAYRLLYLKEKYLETVKEKEIIEKIKEKIK